MLRDVLFAGLFFFLGAIFTAWLFYRIGKAKREEQSDQIERQLADAIRSVDEIRTSLKLPPNEAEQREIAEVLRRAKQRGVHL